MPDVGLTDLFEPFEDSFGLSDEERVSRIENRRGFAVDPFGCSQYGWSNRWISRRSAVWYDLRLANKDELVCVNAYL